MKQSTAAFLLHKVLGWTGQSNFPTQGKALFLGIPHTSVWDFVVAYLYARSEGGKINILIKEKFFFWPIGGILRRCGAIPLHNSKQPTTSNIIYQMVEAFKENDNILMGIAPEGTRKPVKRWKTGFHIIASKAGVPVYAGFIDWGRKQVGYGEIFPLTDDPHADMLRLQQHYKDLGVKAKFPEKFVFDDSIK